MPRKFCSIIEPLYLDDASAPRLLLLALDIHIFMHDINDPSSSTCPDMICVIRLKCNAVGRSENPHKA